MKKNNLEFNITIWLNEQDYKKVQAYSKKYGIPISNLGRKVMRKFLNEEAN